MEKKLSERKTRVMHILLILLPLAALAQLGCLPIQCSLAGTTADCLRQPCCDSQLTLVGGTCTGTPSVPDNNQLQVPRLIVDNFDVFSFRSFWCLSASFFFLAVSVSESFAQLRRDLCRSLACFSARGVQCCHLPSPVQSIANTHLSVID